METKFQTSFIPKKPLPASGGSAIGSTVGINTAKPKHISSLFLNLGILFFIISLGMAGGVYAWKSISLSQQSSYKQALVDRQKQFNPDLITELKRTNVKIDTAKRLLSSHLALSNIFDIIGQFTIQNVRFINLDLTAPTDQSPGIKIAMNGQGTNLQAVAFQSDVLSSLGQYNLSKIVKNPAISNPGFDTNGAVSFGFSATVDPTTFIYKGTQ